ncbi:hypothetical protein D3C76_1464010 [compost metagenome]
MFALRVFSTVDKAAQIALLYPAETVRFFFNTNGVTKRGQGGLRQGEVNVMTQRLNMDQHIALGGRCQPLAQWCERLQLFGSLAIGKVMPNVGAKSDNRT